MNSTDLICAFQDTLEIAEGPILKEETERCVRETRVYEENYVSPLRTIRSAKENAVCSGLYILPCTTLQAAEKYYHQTKGKQRLPSSILQIRWSRGAVCFEGQKLRKKVCAVAAISTLA